MSQHDTRPDPEDWGEPLMPVPRFGRSQTGLVPVRWVAKVICLTAGTTAFFLQLILWAGWNREPVWSLLAVSAGLMGMPGAISLDEKRQRR